MSERVFSLPSTITRLLYIAEADDHVFNEFGRCSDIFILWKQTGITNAESDSMVVRFWYLMRHEYCITKNPSGI